MKNKKLTKEKEGIKGFVLTITFALAILVVIALTINLFQRGLIGNAFEYQGGYVELSDYPYPFVENNQVNTYVVVSDGATTGEIIAANDVYIKLQESTAVWEDEDADGYTLEVDCDDTNSLIYPGAVEMCDGLDNDCDNDIDEGGACGNEIECTADSDCGIPMEIISESGFAVDASDRCISDHELLDLGYDWVSCVNPGTTQSYCEIGDHVSGTGGSTEECGLEVGVSCQEGACVVDEPIITTVCMMRSLDSIDETCINNNYEWGNCIGATLIDYEPCNTNKANGDLCYASEDGFPNSGKVFCENGCGNGVCLDEATLLCGNSVLEEGESCDDSNNADGDGCSNNCEFESPNCYDSDNTRGDKVASLANYGYVDSAGTRGYDECEDNRVILEQICYDQLIYPDGTIIQGGSASQKDCISHGYSACENGVCVTAERSVTGAVTGNFVLDPSVSGIVSASEVSNISAQNIIAIGNPCDNPVVDNFISCEAWPLSEGQAMIQLFDNGNNLALVAAGSTEEDIKMAAKVLANFDDYDFSGDEVCVIGTPDNFVIFNRPCYPQLIEKDIWNLKYQDSQYERDCEILNTGNDCDLYSAEYEHVSGGIGTLAVAVEVHEELIDNNEFITRLKSVLGVNYQESSWLGQNYVMYQGGESDNLELVIVWYSGNTVAAVEIANWNSTQIDDGFLEPLLEAYLEKYPSDLVFESEECDVRDTLMEGEGKMYYPSGNPYYIRNEDIIEGDQSSPKKTQFLLSAGMTGLLEEGEVFTTVNNSKLEINEIFIDEDNVENSFVEFCFNFEEGYDFLIEQDIGDLVYIESDMINDCEMLEMYFDASECSGTYLADYSYPAGGINQVIAIVENHIVDFSNDEVIGYMKDELGYLGNIDLEYRNGNAYYIFYEDTSQEIINALIFWISGDNIIFLAFSGWDHGLVSEDVIISIHDAYMAKYPSDLVIEGYCGDGICNNVKFDVENGSKEVILYEGIGYEVEVKSISIFNEYRAAVITVNGERIDVDQGETHVLSSGVSLYVDEISTSADGIQYVYFILGENEGNCPVDCMIEKDCGELKESSKEYFDLCLNENYESVCFDKYTARYLGCSDVSGDGCVYNNMNAERNIHCLVEAETCTDSDANQYNGGLNYYVKGEVVRCSEQGQSGGCSGMEDRCITYESEYNLEERFCQDGLITTQPYNCPNGCFDGACFGILDGTECSVDAVPCDLEWGVPVCGSVTHSSLGEPLCEVESPLGESAGFNFDNLGCSTVSLCKYGCNNGVCIENLLPKIIDFQSPEIVEAGEGFEIRIKAVDDIQLDRIGYYIYRAPDEIVEVVEEPTEYEVIEEPAIEDPTAVIPLEIKIRSDGEVSLRNNLNGLIFCEGVEDLGICYVEGYELKIDIDVTNEGTVVTIINDETDEVICENKKEGEICYVAPSSSSSGGSGGGSSVEEPTSGSGGGSSGGSSLEEMPTDGSSGGGGGSGGVKIYGHGEVICEDDGCSASFGQEGIVQAGEYLIQAYAVDSYGGRVYKMAPLFVEITKIRRSYRLRQGWNLVSTPIIPENRNVRVVFADIMNNLDKIYAYERGWKVFNANSDIPSNLYEIKPGQAYWIKMTNSDVWDVEGSLFVVEGDKPPRPPEILVSPGWNLIGVHSLYKLEMNDYFENIDGDYLSLWTYENGQPVKLDINSNPILRPGDGYWLFMKDEGEIIP